MVFYNGIIFVLTLMEFDNLVKGTTRDTQGQRDDLRSLLPPFASRKKFLLKGV